MKRFLLAVRRACGRFVLILLIIVAGAACVQGATVRGRLDRQGRDGRPYPAIYVPVTLYNKQKGRSRPAYSDVRGMYYLYNVPPDDYYLEVWISKDHPVSYPIHVADPATDIPAILLQ